MSQFWTPSEYAEASRLGGLFGRVEPTDDDIEEAVVRMRRDPLGMARYEREKNDTLMYEESMAAFMRAGWPWAREVDQYLINWHIDCVCDYLTAAIDWQLGGLVIFTLPPGHMKLIADSADIATPDGYKKHGDVRPNDYVFGPNGLPTRVRAISPKGIANIEVEFANGEIIKVNSDHLWTVFDCWRYGKNKWRTIDTATLMRLNKSPHRCRFMLPDFSCLQFDNPHRELTLHPYFLGCWLGDGRSTASDISHDRDDHEHIAKLESLGYRVTNVWNNGGNGIRSNFGKQDICAKLKGIGVFGNKKIPDQYATASVEARLELLAGIIDTDGYVEPVRGRVRISTCDHGFAEQIERLGFSLGFRPYITEAKAPGYGEYAANHQRVYQVCFDPTRDIPTALPRKRIVRTDFSRRKIGIVDIRPAKIVEQGHCLNVEREDGLYLVGRTNLVTHNSLGINVFFPAWAWAQDPKKGAPDNPRFIRPNSWRGPGLRFMSLGYQQRLIRQHAQQNLDLIRSPWYQNRWKNRFTLAAEGVDEFNNDKGGRRLSMSSGGGMTGFGAQIIALDDVHNVQSDSFEAERIKMIDAWDNALQSRLRDVHGLFILSMQRTAKNDLIGHILATKYNGVQVCLPYEFERRHPYVFAKKHVESKEQTEGQGRTFELPVIRKSDSSGGLDVGPRIGEVWEDRRVEGDVLWEKKWPKSAIDERTKGMTSHQKAGQYQQRPTSAEGGMFKRHFFEPTLDIPDIPSFIAIKNLVCVRAWDLAWTEAGAGKDADYTVGVLMGRDPQSNVVYILDVIRGLYSPAHLEQVVIGQAAIDGLSVKVRIPQDPGAGKFVAHQLSAQLIGYDVIVELEHAPKAQRAAPLISGFERHVVVLRTAPWNHDFVDELCSFTVDDTHDHDDQIDAAAGGLRALVRAPVWNAVGA